jgi:tetratricopeptide (TPR) repeat protein
MLRALLFAVLLSSFAAAQSNADHQKYDQALREIEAHRFTKAEKLLNAVIASAPNWPLAYLTMGRLYYLWPKPAVAITAYEQARDLDLKDHSLTPGERHEVNDQLGVLYGLGKQFDKSIAVLEAAIKDDPNYGEYEYNLACDYSEKGDLNKALTHLQRAYDLRSTFKFPDPRQDDSFKQWLDNDKFKEAVSGMMN